MEIKPDRFILRYIVLLAVLIFQIRGQCNTSPVANRVKIIVIDAGHGGKDPGCSGVDHKEKHVTLAVALKLGKLIEEKLKDVKVIYTRKTDVFVELEERAQIANRNNADLFISIHCNAAAYTEIKVVNGKKRRRDVINTRPYGSETYVMGIKNEAGKTSVMKRENAAILLEENYKQTYNGFDPNSDESYILLSMFAETYVEQSAKFAAEIQKEYKTRVGRIDKGVKRQSLWVLWRTKMPSVLTEIGYLTNIEEEKFIGSEKGQFYIAAGIFRAFRNYKSDIEGTSSKFDDDIENMEVVVNENLARGDSSYLKSIEDFQDDTDTSEMTPHEKIKQLGQEAERLYSTGDYNGSEKKYLELLRLVPGDKLSKEKIASINSLRKKYQSLLDQGDKFFSLKNYVSAKKSYEEAQAVLSKEQYPTDKIKACDKLLIEKNNQQNNKAAIERLLSKAIDLMDNGNYGDARIKFEEVLKMEPTQPVALKKLAECRDFSDPQKINYSKLLKEGDELLAKKKFQEAKSKFYQASLINPSDDYPKNKIREITQVNAIDPNEKTNSPGADTVKKVSQSTLSAKILFKVQFIQSAKELDLKDTKLSLVEQVSCFRVNGVYKYTAGAFSRLEDALSYRDKLKGMGYKDAFVVAFAGSEKVDLKTAIEILSQQKIQ